MSEDKYSENYLNVSCKTYPPYSDYRKYLRGGSYMLTDEYKRNIITEVGDSAYLLFDYYYSHYTYNYFKPDDSEKIGKDLGWSAKKVDRLRGKLKKANYILILKETMKDKSLYYRVLMGKEIVLHYLNTGNINTGTELIRSQEDVERMLNAQELENKKRIDELEHIITYKFPTDDDYNELAELKSMDENL